MKSFNMKDTDLKHTISRIGWKLEQDEKGRLFHPDLRAMFDPLKVELGAIEALSAVHFAGRSVHLLQERWAEQHGLSEGRLGVLFRLYRCGDMPLGDLANDLDSTPRNITGLVDQVLELSTEIGDASRSGHDPDPRVGDPGVLHGRAGRSPRRRLSPNESVTCSAAPARA